MPTMTDTIELKINLAQVNLIMVALMDQPYKNVAELINDLRQQIQPQIKQDDSNVAKIQRS